MLAILKKKGNIKRDGEEIEEENKDRLKEVLKNIRKVEAKFKYKASNITAGEYSSIFKGSGIEFSEIREYKAGDDVKRIDWKATSRFNKAFVKEYIEERNINIYFIVDISPSTNLGSESTKRIKAAEVVGELSFSALRKNDYISLILVSDTVEKALPLKKGKKHVMGVLREIIYHKTKRKATNLGKALKEASHILKKRGIVIIISDLLDTSQFLDELKRLRRKNKVLIIHIYDPLELEFPELEGNIIVEDSETGEIGIIDAQDKESITLYNKIRKEEREKIRRALRKEGIEMISISTKEITHNSLMRLFKERGKKR